jgi:hypothetical protein
LEVVREGLTFPLVFGVTSSYVIIFLTKADVIV